MTLWRRILQERRAVIIPLAALIVANVAVLALWVLPLERAVSTATDRVDESRHELAMAQVVLKSARDQRSSKDLAQQQLKTFYEQVLPTSLQDAINLVDFGLQGLARESGITEKNGERTWETPKDSPLVRVPGRIVLDGDYHSIRRFLFALEAARPFVVVERVELSESNSSQSNSGPQNTGTAIEVTLALATYYLAAPGGAGR